MGETKQDVFHEEWVCNTCGKPACAIVTNKPVVICKCDTPKWLIVNTKTGEEYATPRWWSDKHPELSAVV